MYGRCYESEYLKAHFFRPGSTKCQCGKRRMPARRANLRVLPGGKGKS